MRDYGYLNARLRARKTQLLSRATLASLSRSANSTELTAGLLGTVYKPDLEWGRLRSPGVAGLEEGLRRHAVATVRKVAECARTNQEALGILGILVARWDAHNLRTLLRGQHISAPPHEIRESLVPLGRLDESQLAELAAQASLKAMIDLLVMWGNPYARPLVAGYPQYARDHDLSALELKLDQYHYGLLTALTRRRLPGLLGFPRGERRRRPAVRPLSRGRTLSVALVREMVQREIDVVNLVTLLRVSREGLTAEECRTFYIPGGKVVAERLFGRLAGQRVESLVEGLRGTPYGELLGAALPQFKERGTVSLLERKLEEYLVTQAVALFCGDLLSSAVMIAYLQAKFNELVNLRLLARGKEAKLPEATIREALILV